MFCSTIIPTIGRPSLSRAVCSVLDQEFSHHDFEVIVVNDSERSLPYMDWQNSPRVRIIDTNRHERSVARNTGAAIPKGNYLHFLDDDDWMAPTALQSLWQLAQTSHAAWLYGRIRIVDETHSTLAEINSGLNGNCFSQIVGGAWAPIQSSMVKSRAFFEVGGYNPFICGTEDEDLCRRIAYHGDFANTPAMVACLYRGQAWNTSTNYLRAPQDTKYSRDLILSYPKAFQRLWVSARSSFWYGRILRVYLSTISWNLKQKRFFTALSRMFYSLAFLVLSMKHVFAVDYWRGVRMDHVPDTLHFVIKEYEQKSRNENQSMGQRS